MATWISFKQLREKIRIADLLRHYNVELKVRGEKATGLCPLPTHPMRTDGKKRSPSFSVHLTKGIWHCFGCSTSGNALDLAARLQGLNPDDPAQLRRAALKLTEIFDVSCENSDSPAKKATTVARPEHPAPPPQSAIAVPGVRVLVNEPIDFELKNLDPQHPYLVERGLHPETVSHFGLGFCSRGMMKDRIAIPIHNPIGQLVGYAGRLVDDAKIDSDHPRYLFPGQRRREDVLHEFRKSMLVYNLHRVTKRADDLIVVEGFASVWWLHQQGFVDVVALMGSSCSSEQAKMISEHMSEDARIWLMPDGNNAGAQLASQSLPLLAVYRFSRLIQLNVGRQPTDYTRDELCQLLRATKSVLQQAQSC